MKIFIAGATGAVGLPLTRTLVALGHEVSGLTREGPAVDELRAIGATPVCADVFDAPAIETAVVAAAPDILVDQLTRLPADPSKLVASMAEDTRLHREGGANLLAAATAAGVRRYVMQSRAFFLAAEAGTLAGEGAIQRQDAPGALGESCRAFAEYERRVIDHPTIDGTVLRYGFFYGPGTWYRPDGASAEQARERNSPIIGEGAGVWSFVHIDDAIAATVASLTSAPGTYNIVDDDPLPVSEWLPAFARWVGAPEPVRVDRDEALTNMGPEAVFYHTSLVGASNTRAKAELRFSPRRLLWGARHAAPGKRVPPGE